MELIGKVCAVLEAQSGTSKSGNAWKTQDFVIETGDKYPKKVCFRLFGDRVSSCPKVGQEVIVSFDVESREWNGKWFTQLNAWKVENNSLLNKAQESPAPVIATVPVSYPTGNPTGNGDLPF